MNTLDQFQPGRRVQYHGPLNGKPLHPDRVGKFATVVRPVKRRKCVTIRWEDTGQPYDAMVESLAFAETPTLNLRYSIQVRHRDGTAGFPDDEIVDRASALSLIESGEWDRPLAVFEINEADGTRRDVSADFASEIAHSCQQGNNPLYPGLYNFIADHLGMQVAVQFEVA